MDTDSQLDLARTKIESGDFEAAHVLLLPLVTQGCADAIDLHGP